MAAAAFSVCLCCLPERHSHLKRAPPPPTPNQQHNQYHQAPSLNFFPRLACPKPTLSRIINAGLQKPLSQLRGVHGPACLGSLRSPTSSPHSAICPRHLWAARWIRSTEPASDCYLLDSKPSKHSTTARTGGLALCASSGSTANPRAKLSSW